MILRTNADGSSDMISDSGVFIARDKPVRAMLDTPMGHEFIRRMTERLGRDIDDATFALLSKKP